MYMVMLFPPAEHPLSAEVRKLPPKMQDIINLPSMMNKKEKKRKALNTETQWLSAFIN